MRFSNTLRSVLMIWISVLINAISSVFLPVISKIPAAFSRRADKPSPNILKSERNASKITENSLSLFRFGSLFFNLDSLMFFKFTTVDICCQGRKGQESNG